MGQGKEKKIGKYLLGKILGHGGMGVVYHAYDPDVDRPVAIKTLHAHLIATEEDSNYLARFRQEAQSAAKCVHPNIVTILELGQGEESPYIVMEYVSGTSLDQWVQKGKKLTLKLVLKIVSQILSALDKAHSMDIVHRDIKPANIIVTDDGTVKLTDFGIARVTSNPKLTRAGYVVGTLDYMAPEQRAGHEVDNRADLFSVALVFHQLLCDTPIPRGVAAASLPALSNMPPEITPDYKSKVPQALIPVIRKGLAASPGKRFQSAREFAQAIKSTLSELKGDGSGKLVTRNEPRHSDETAVIRSQPNHTQRTVEISPSAAYNTQSITQTGFTQSTSGQARSGILSNIDEATLIELKEHFSKYVGESAGNLVNKHSEDAISFAELIYSLAAEIGKEKDRKRFLRRWQD